MGISVAIILLLALTQECLTQEGKSISIFNVVKFPNDACQGSGSQNGTCYTAEECSSIGGTNAGSCAEGYGVCCTVSLTCTTGSMSHSTSQNNTHLILAATTSPPQQCNYAICPLSSSICRIRLDFEQFTLAGPYVWTSGGQATEGGAMGKCQTDTFSATGSLGGSPVICGGNQNQHMFVDTDGTKCSTADFAFGGTTVISRQFNIKVTQFNCADRDIAGPSGCLQFFTNVVGTVSSFNYPIGAAAVLTAAANPATAFQHLASQSYSICFRQGAGNCALCFIPAVRANIAAGMQSFGLSVSSTAAMSETATCNTDYLVIPGAMISEAAAKAVPKAIGVQRICGAFFVAADNAAAAAATTVCTGAVPFRIRFETDANEADVQTDGTTADELNLGIVGFSLDYWQSAC